MKQGKNIWKYIIFSFVCAFIVVSSIVGVMRITDVGYSPVAEFFISLGVVSSAVALLLLAHKLLVLSVSADLEFERVAALAAKMDMFAVVWNSSFTRVWCNSKFTDATGFVPEDLTDIEAMKKIFPADAFDKKTLGKFLENSSDFFNVHGKNGAGVYVSWATSEMFSDAATDEKYYLSVSHNLNQKFRMMSDLEEFSSKLTLSEQRYNFATKLTEIGILLKYSDRDDYYTNGNLRTMLGFSADEEYLSKAQLMEKIHPSERFLFEQFIQPAGISPDREDDVHSIEFRAVSAEGDYRWYMLRYKTIADEYRYIEGGALLDITDDRQKDMMIEKMAFVDELTQIGNRNRFLSLGEEVLEVRANDSSIDYWVIVLDVDEIHLVNDSCGYQAGSELLKKIALIAMSVLPAEGMCARVGGDNFALMVRCSDDEELPVRIMQSIQERISKLRGGGLEHQNITVSAGYCKLSDGDGRNFSHILDLAEFALTERDGIKNTYIRYNRELRRKALDTAKTEHEIELALDNREFVLYYQPKIDLSTGEVIGAEALIRWIKPDGTLIPPMDFIPIAERSMIITKISRFVLHEACRQNKEWQDMGLGHFVVSINLTAIDFYRTDVTGIIRETLDSTGLDPKYLDIELTESLAMKDIGHAIDQMLDMRSLGVLLSMDDFGTGYSSLSYIQKLPITLLKLDRSFVMYMEDDEVSREIVSAVIRIAKSKKIGTVAEGIESQHQADILRVAGCDYAQGFFFGKPMPAQEFERFMKSRQKVQ